MTQYYEGDPSCPECGITIIRGECACVPVAEVPDDAARYRWLREHWAGLITQVRMDYDTDPATAFVVRVGISENLICPTYPDSLDNAIDAAVEASERVSDTPTQA